MVKKIVIPLVVLAAILSMAFFKMTDAESAAIGKDAPNDSYDPIVVLELFTSQGCSSCPPADALLERLKRQYPEEVFALSYHVDYWNYIGWEDPFSKPIHAQKQRFYNQKFRYSGNYTPQLVVNGQEHFVGSNSSKAYAKVKRYAATKVRNHVKITKVEVADGEVNFDFNIEGELAGRQLRGVLLIDERTTVVKRGENRNRTLKNTNIVVGEGYLDELATTGSGTLALPPLVGKDDALTLMLLLETEELDITAAAKVAVKS